jgi:hypothetical protein
MNCKKNIVDSDNVTTRPLDVSPLTAKTIHTAYGNLRPRRSLLLCAMLLCVLAFSACKDTTTNGMSKKGSGGKTLELLLVANHDVYTGTTRQLLDSLFAHPQDGLNQPEPVFDIANIPVSSYENTEMFHSHRNVLICDVNVNNRNKVYRDVDKYAEPQIIYQFSASDSHALDSLLKHYYPMVLEDLYTMEYRRIERVYSKDFNPDIMNTIRKTFGFDVTVPSEYYIAPPVTNDFMWIRKETKDVSQDVLIQVEPYTSQSQFEEANLLNHIDTMMKRHVPGPADGSYIGTERRLMFYTYNRKIDNQYAKEIRGVYRCFGDFYSGPFVTYAVVTPDQKNIVLITAFVFSPRKDKRDLLMQVDGICRTIKFNKK